MREAQRDKNQLSECQQTAEIPPKSEKTAARARSRRTKKAPPKLIKIQPSKGKNRATHTQAESMRRDKGDIGVRCVSECDSRRCSAPGRRLRRVSARAPSGPRGRQGLHHWARNSPPRIWSRRWPWWEARASNSRPWCGVDAAPIRQHRVDLNLGRVPCRLRALFSAPEPPSLVDKGARSCSRGRFESIDLKTRQRHTKHQTTQRPSGATDLGAQYGYSLI